MCCPANLLGESSERAGVMTHQIYASVIATRTATATVHRSVHVVSVGYEGPSRAIEWLASKIADDLSGDWSINVIQITQYEYNAFVRKRMELEPAQ